MRLATGVPTPLYPGMMIMLGKHQVWCLVLMLYPSPASDRAALPGWQELVEKWSYRKD